MQGMSKQKSGNAGDGQKGATSMKAAVAGSAKVKGGATIKGDTGKGGLKPQKSGNKGG